MDMVTKLTESSTIVQDNADGTWKVRLISEGKGSSGTYSRELLTEYRDAFDEVLSFVNHPAEGRGPWDRTFTEIAGQVKGETWLEEDDETGLGVYANWEPHEAYAEALTKYRKKLGLSIFIEGDGKKDKNGEFIVESFNREDPYRSVDVVIAPGARGRFLEAAKTSAATAREHENEGTTVTPEEIAEIRKAVAEALKEFDFSGVIKPLIAEALAPQSREDEVDLAAVVDAVAEANLPQSLRTAVIEKFQSGTKIEDAIKEQKTVYNEIVESVKADKANEGRVVEGSLTEYEFKGFGGSR